LLYIVVVASTVKGSVVSVRIDAGLLGQLDDLAQEMERSRSYLIELAVREFVEHEYASLTAVREGEAQFVAGKGVPHEQVSKWIAEGALEHGARRRT
jgi:predicted transcriptional regulator